MFLRVRCGITFSYIFLRFFHIVSWEMSLKLRLELKIQHEICFNNYAEHAPMEIITSALTEAK
jgi:hypothetical protein